MLLRALDCRDWLAAKGLTEEWMLLTWEAGERNKSNEDEDDKDRFLWLLYSRLLEKCVVEGESLLLPNNITVETPSPLGGVDANFTARGLIALWEGENKGMAVVDDSVTESSQDEGRPKRLSSCSRLVGTPLDVVWTILDCPYNKMATVGITMTVFWMMRANREDQDCTSNHARHIVVAIKPHHQQEREERKSDRVRAGIHFDLICYAEI